MGVTENIHGVINTINKRIHDIRFSTTFDMSTNVCSR